MILTTKTFEEKFSKLNSSSKNDFDNFCKFLESAAEDEIFNALSGGESLNSLMTFDFQGVKIHYSLSRNKQNQLDINFFDISSP